MLVARAGHPTVRNRVTKAQLAALRHVEVQVAPGGGAGRWPPSYAALGVARDIAVVVPTFTAAAAVVASTDLVASLPGEPARRAGAAARAAPGGDAARAPSGPPINLLWHERTHQDPALRAFRELVARAVAART